MVGGIIPLRWAQSSRYGGRLRPESAKNLEHHHRIERRTATLRSVRIRKRRVEFRPERLAAPLAFQLSPKAAFLNRKTLPFVLISFLRSPSRKRFFDIGEKHSPLTGPSSPNGAATPSSRSAA